MSYVLVIVFYSVRSVASVTVPMPDEAMCNLAATQVILDHAKLDEPYRDVATYCVRQK